LPIVEGPGIEPGVDLVDGAQQPQHLDGFYQAGDGDLGEATVEESENGQAESIGCFGQKIVQGASDHWVHGKGGRPDKGFGHDAALVEAVPEGWLGWDHGGCGDGRGLG